MDLIRVFQQFPDHESCIEHLEKTRWNDNPHCPRCTSDKVGRKADGDRIGRWNCQKCHASFNVLSGTIFQGTRVPLQKWFLAISLMLNAKKSLSSHQMGRDLDLNQKTAWYMMMRIRRAMVEDGEMLFGIVEMDECYIGGKPRRSNNRDDDRPAPRGRGTRKLPVLGAVERGGRVVARPSIKVSAREILEFVSRHVSTDESLLVTDNYGAYRGMHRHVRHASVDHRRRYVDGQVHTNTIEGFWALLKRAWYGQHHHYSNHYAIAPTSPKRRSSTTSVILQTRSVRSCAEPWGV